MGQMLHALTNALPQGLLDAGRWTLMHLFQFIIWPSTLTPKYVALHD